MIHNYFINDEVQSFQASRIGQENHGLNSFLTFSRKTKKSEVFSIFSYVLNGVAMGSMEKRLPLLLATDDPRDSYKTKLRNLLRVKVLIAKLSKFRITINILEMHSKSK